VIDGAQKRRFSGARPAEKHGELAATKGDGGLTERRHAIGVGDADILEADDRIWLGIPAHALPLAIETTAGFQSAIVLGRPCDGDASSG
jgi:hypothetical protein